VLKNRHPPQGEQDRKKIRVLPENNIKIRNSAVFGFFIAALNVLFIFYLLVKALAQTPYTRNTSRAKFNVFLFKRELVHLFLTRPSTDQISEAYDIKTAL